MLWKKQLNTMKFFSQYDLLWEILGIEKNYDGKRAKQPISAASMDPDHRQKTRSYGAPA